MDVGMSMSLGTKSDCATAHGFQIYLPHATTKLIATMYIEM